MGWSAKVECLLSIRKAWFGSSVLQTQNNQGAVSATKELVAKSDKRAYVCVCELRTHVI